LVENADEQFLGKDKQATLNFAHLGVAQVDSKYIV